MSSNPSTLLQTALHFIDGYNKWDIDLIMAPRAQNCTHRVYPARLNRPVYTNETYREFFGKVMPLFTNFHLTILETVEDPANNKVAMHAQSQAETSFGPYANEYMIILEMTPDHTQVLNAKEFVDSGYSDDFFKRLGVYSNKQ